MDKKLNFNNVENDDFNMNTQDRDYQTLTVRLKEITLTIALLEKIIFNKV